MPRARPNRLLNSKVYLGEATHKGVSYPGEHAPIIDLSLWDKLHSNLQTSPRYDGLTCCP
jgi:hypothetical protein